MPKSAKTFTSLFLLAGICFFAGVYFCIIAKVSDPLANSPVSLVAGACFIGFGLAAGYMGVQAFRHHRAVVLHITRRDHRRVRVRKRRTPGYGAQDTPEKADEL